MRWGMCVGLGLEDRVCKGGSKSSFGESIYTSILRRNWVYYHRIRLRLRSRLKVILDIQHVCYGGTPNRLPLLGRSSGSRHSARYLIPPIPTHIQDNATGLTSIPMQPKPSTPTSGAGTSNPTLPATPATPKTAWPCSPTPATNSWAGS